MIPWKMRSTSRSSSPPQLLRFFLKSKGYVVCTGTFKWFLNLATVSQSGDVSSTMMSTSEAIGYERIEQLIQVLCGDFVYNASIRVVAMGRHVSDMAGLAHGKSMALCLAIGCDFTVGGTYSSRLIAPVKILGIPYLDEVGECRIRR